MPRPRESQPIQLPRCLLCRSRFLHLRLQLRHHRLRYRSSLFLLLLQLCRNEQLWEFHRRRHQWCLHSGWRHWLLDRELAVGQTRPTNGNPDHSSDMHRVCSPPDWLGRHLNVSCWTFPQRSRSWHDQLYRAHLHLRDRASCSKRLDRGRPRHLHLLVICRVFCIPDSRAFLV